MAAEVAMRADGAPLGCPNPECTKGEGAGVAMVFTKSRRGVACPSCRLIVAPVNMLRHRRILP